MTMFSSGSLRSTLRLLISALPFSPCAISKSNLAPLLHELLLMDDTRVALTLAQLGPDDLAAARTLMGSGAIYRMWLRSTGRGSWLTRVWRWDMLTTCKGRATLLLTSLAILSILKPTVVETYIRMLHDTYGLNLLGPETSSEIRRSLNRTLLGIRQRAMTTASNANVSNTGPTTG